MMEGSTKPQRVEGRLAGQPIRLGERTMQPLARVTGSTGGAQLHMPVEVLVTDANGHIYRVPISVPRSHRARWLALAGALVLPLPWFLRRTWRRRRAF